MIADPQVSVVMPVYNAGKYLHAAIASILQQELEQLELIIVNDCATDESDAIIRSFPDDRISYLQHEKNKGVVAAANFGLQQARAPYTAVMHADDIAEPSRLRKQKAWLDEHMHVAAVGCFITFMDEQGRVTGTWNDDRQNYRAQDIKRTMPWRNCLAHPTAMLRTPIYQELGYFFNQQAQEDYDLWLRMLSRGLIIEKIPEPLLLYREHAASITGTILRKANPYFKQLDCKKKFLQHQVLNRNWGYFENIVLATLCFDGVMGIGKIIKRNILK